MAEDCDISGYVEKQTGVRPFAKKGLPFSDGGNENEKTNPVNSSRPVYGTEPCADGSVFRRGGLRLCNQRAECHQREYSQPFRCDGYDQL